MSKHHREYIRRLIAAPAKWPCVCSTYHFLTFSGEKILHHSLGAIMHMKLDVNVLQVRPHSGARNREALTNFKVSKPLGDQGKNLSFPAGY
jgi:hypothetical protein